MDKQLVIDALHHKQYLTSFRRNPHCRFLDHDRWTIQKLDLRAGKLTIGQALELGRHRASGEKNSVGLRVEGKPFVRKLTCMSCGHTKSLLRLQSSLRTRTCARCGQGLVAAGLDLFERLDAAGLSPRQLGRTLASIGLRPGDVFSVGDHSNETHFEICGDKASKSGH